MDKLQFIAQQLESLSVPYEFGQWSSDVRYPYFVGEITEDPITTEDGNEDSTLLLTGFHRGQFDDLETVKETIKRHFCPICGLCARTDSGSIAVFFDGSTYVPTGEADLKRIQINLKIKEWKGGM